MEIIKKLKPNQIFVFGSNANGHHAGGAARQALDKFGAEWGNPAGLQGQSYAIVTLDSNMCKVTHSFILQQLVTLNTFAADNPDKEILVTPIGCGIAGFSVDEINKLFQLIKWQPNVILPDEFI